MQQDVRVRVCLVSVGTLFDVELNMVDGTVILSLGDLNNATTGYRTGTVQSYTYRKNLTQSVRRNVG